MRKGTEPQAMCTVNQPGKKQLEDPAPPHGSSGPADAGSSSDPPSPPPRGRGGESRTERSVVSRDGKQRAKKRAAYSL